MSGMEEVLEILVKHVLLTSRNGFAACAAEGCPWEDRFHRWDKYEEVPLHIRAAHAEHQLDLLAAAGFTQRNEV